MQPVIKILPVWKKRTLAVCSYPLTLRPALPTSAPASRSNFTIFKSPAMHADVRGVPSCMGGTGDSTQWVHSMTPVVRGTMCKVPVCNKVIAPRSALPPVPLLWFSMYVPLSGWVSQFAIYMSHKGAGVKRYRQLTKLQFSCHSIYLTFRT